MKSAFRNAYLTLSSRNYSQSQPQPQPQPKPNFPSLLFFPSPNIATTVSFLPILRVETFNPRFSTVFFGSMAGGESHARSLSLEKQFEDFRLQLEESGKLRDRIRNVAMEIESTARLMHANLLLVHQSRPIPGVLEKPKAQIPVLRELYSRLAEVVHECPGQYHRYHGDWKSETQSVVSLLALLHWFETGNLLLHTEAQEKLGLNDSDFVLDVDDYLVGLCFMSNELPRYVVNQVTAGDYDCPKKVLKFMTELHASFRKLDLRNDFLRKKFDGMKYDLRKVEEVYYDVKIRGLAANDE